MPGGVAGRAVDGPVPVAAEAVEDGVKQPGAMIPADGPATVMADRERMVRGFRGLAGEATERHGRQVQGLMLVADPEAPSRPASSSRKSFSGTTPST